MKTGWICFVGFGLLCVLLMGCGSGSGGGSASAPPTSPPTPPTSPPPASFTVSLSPASVTLDRGGPSETVQISVTPQNGFSGDVSVTSGDSPAGVKISPASLSVNPGSPGTLTLSASSTASIVQQAVPIHAISGTLTANASLQIDVKGASIPDPFYPVGGSLVHGFYDPSRKLLFATNFTQNELDVISGVDLRVIARVPVPQPMGIDQMADGKTLVIGTEAQEIVTVDEDTLAVTLHPYMDPNAPRLFFPTVCAMANGKVLVIGLEQGIDSNSIYEGGQYLYEWDSTTNTFTRIQPTAGTKSFYEVDSLARSADHKWAVFAADQFYLYSSDSDSFTSASLYTVDPPNDIYGVRGYAINSDGSEIAVASAQQVTFLNHSLQAIGSAPLPGDFQLARSSVQFSTDNQKLYLQYPFPVAIEEVDPKSFTALGYVSGAVLPDDNLERLLATDASGRAFVGGDGGLRLVSLMQPLTPNPTEGSLLPGPVCPAIDAVLPLNSPQEVQLGSSLSGESIFVGGQPAPIVAAKNLLKIPASSTAGPADVECVDQHGNVAVLADGVSYGVDPIAFSANLVPPFGNPPSYLFGYGFNSVQGGSLYSLRLDGRPTQRMVAEQDVGLGTIEAEGFLVPDGNPGETASITVSSPQGTGTLPAATMYYAKPTILSASGLRQLTFDKRRNVLYALKGNEIDVLDAVTLEWKSPLKFPAAANGSYSAMALSPDGSTLVVGGTMGTSPQFIVLDPDGFSSPAVLTDTKYYNYAPGAPESGSIVVTNSNEVWMAGVPDVVLDLSTKSFSTLPEGSEAFSRRYGEVLRASADGSHIYSAELNDSGGGVFSIDPATHAISKTPSFGYMFWTDLAVSPDGSKVAAVYAPPDGAGDIVGFFNSDLQYINANVYPGFSPPDDSGVVGATFSPEGKVLIVPQGDSIEFWDAATGKLRTRLMTPERLHVLVYPEGAVAPQIALDSTGQTIYAISASGLTVLTLPEPMDQMPPAMWPSRQITANLRQELNGSLKMRVMAMQKKHRK